MLPLLVNLCLVILIGDSDNVIGLLMGDGLLPLAVLAVGSRRLGLSMRTTPAGPRAAAPGTIVNKMPLEGC
jgi:hypothetical protein